jgi:uncharacterized protein YodC (DUF2158 family)
LARLDVHERKQETDMSMPKAGDVVRLKSGGPLMTVLAASDDQVWTQWFDESGSLRLKPLNPVTLQIEQGSATDTRAHEK